MVPRYSRPEMTAIWSAENRYRIWWQIEVFAAEAMGKIGMIRGHLVTYRHSSPLEPARFA